MMNSTGEIELKSPEKITTVAVGRGAAVNTDRGEKVQTDRFGEDQTPKFVKRSPT
jgi:hypothetical protein